MSIDSTPLAARMKEYEDCYRIKLPRFVPKIIRIDGKAFHTFLKDAVKPYDTDVAVMMEQGAKAVIQEIGGTARLAYIQSDECSIIINDGLTINTSSWFDNNIQKMASVSASVFGAVFNDVHNRFVRKSPLSAKFDARVFVMPNISEVTNYLIWRQQDATRNSIQQYGRSQFSHRELEFKSCDEIQEMLFQKAGFNWNSAVPWTKRGFVVTKAATDWIIPKFTEDRTYIETLYNPINEEQTDNS